jgi:hypothetical protein
MITSRDRSTKDQHTLTSETTSKHDDRLGDRHIAKASLSDLGIRSAELAVVEQTVCTGAW